MFKFIKKHPQIKQLDEVIRSIEVNAANNYKDAAQQSLKEFEELFKKLEETGQLNQKEKTYYAEKLSAFQHSMKNFTHKDQKCTWT